MSSLLCLLPRECTGALGIRYFSVTLIPSIRTSWHHVMAILLSRRASIAIGRAADNTLVALAVLRALASLGHQRGHSATLSALSIFSERLAVCHHFQYAALPTLAENMPLGPAHAARKPLHGNRCPLCGPSRDQSC
ncbi:hypothetical protein TRVL_09394 [Trypanosoma vivax]|nr:hypothetical protein TRVL_09394 [Trypanosoma vivax]